jgi:uncharacterized protein YbjT (DUF2867 family)
MKVIVFGATGMVGKGVLLEALDSPDVEAVLAVGRSSCGVTHAKLRELLHKDLYEYASVENELKGYDACFFCLGISSAGMKEADYTHITYDLTLAAGRTLVKLNPGMTFIYVSGASTDSTEKGRTMWARVKGKTENDLLMLGFKSAYMFRPGYIHPLRGVTSRTPLYRVAIPLFKAIYPIARAISPDSLTTSVNIGRAMIAAAKNGYSKPILDPKDINGLAAGT